MLTKGLKNSVCFENLLFDPLSDALGHCTEVQEDELGRLSLPSPTLSADDAGLVLALVLEVVQRGLCRRKHMWWHVTHLLSTVLVDSALEEMDSVTVCGCLMHDGTVIFTIS